jgi:DTW domain-containing protein
MNAPLRRAVAVGRAPRPTCHRCWRPQTTCICATIEPVANRTGIVVFQHPRERFHPIGTARIAALGLQNARIERCAPWSDGAALRARLPEGTALLYPTPGGRDLGELRADERPRQLLVLDGTWFLARKIYEAHRWLGELAHVRCAASRRPAASRPSRRSCWRCASSSPTRRGSTACCAPSL